MDVKMANIKLKNVSTNFCLKNVNFKIKDGEFISILGPSGAGKSTLLNVISGLIEYNGEIFFNDINIKTINTNKRKIGYLFQEAYLFPHLTVYENIAFGLKAKNIENKIIIKKIEMMLELFNIQNLIFNYPNNLSGGEKKRVALARSIITEPEILLLDEPFSNLDQQNIEIIQNEIIKIHNTLKITTVLVTHNFEDAKKLADKVLVLINGKIMQFDYVNKIFKNPISEIKHYINN
jgi:ABC-type sugar transport system ATPase subunit